MIYSNDILFDILQILIFLFAVTISVKPLGLYMFKVYSGEKTLCSFLISPLELIIYRLINIDAKTEMNWKEYALSMLAFNIMGLFLLFLILLFQKFLPINPEYYSGFSWHLALNTAVSFVTNTNWQAYSGENTASYFSQMAGLSVQNFLSAATGLAILIALTRGLARKSIATIGNFWVDIVRSVLYILLPIAFVGAIILMSQGVIQNFSHYKQVALTNPYLSDSGEVIDKQVLPMGPVASQESIKELGTNGGGFFGANSAHPFENPTPLSNIIEIFLILLIPTALTYTFGRMINDTKQGWVIFGVMLTLLILSIVLLTYFEYRGNDILLKSAYLQGPNMEGKEVRFGISGFSMFTAVTTGVSCGAVNTMHDSLTPLSGLIPLFLMMLGEVVFGGVGSGLYVMLAYIVIAVFISGLMIGRTPEFLGKKIEITEMWMSVISVLTPSIVILILVAIASITQYGVSSILNPGPHGLSEIIYAFTSAANNNGSAFAGLNANTVFYNLTTALAMFIGRFIPAIAIIYMSQSLSSKKYIPPSVGTLPTNGIAFSTWLILVILIVGALTFFPALSLSPIVEHLIMIKGA